MKKKKNPCLRHATITDEGKGREGQHMLPTYCAECLYRGSMALIQEVLLCLETIHGCTGVSTCFRHILKAHSQCWGMTVHSEIVSRSWLANCH